jgi:glycine/D-amino acid oxidase-like deaminating enzyme
MRTADALIIGGGIVGVACADALAREGLSVLLLERYRIAGGATGAAMGHIVAMTENDPIYTLTRYAQRLWTELAAELPVAAEYREAGTLWIAADDEEMAEVERMHAVHTRAGFPAEVLNAAAVASAEPNLRSGLAGGLLVPRDAVASPAAAAEFLAARAKRHGAEIREATDVVSLGDKGARLTDGAVTSAAYYIVAGGATSSRLIPGLPVRPRKGHLVMTDAYPGFVRHQLVELGYLKSVSGTDADADAVAFNVHPKADGHLLIGSSRQYNDENPNVDASILARMLARAYEYMPDLPHLRQLDRWAGFRAATPDKLPLIGRSRLRPNLYLATGHEGLGITTSLATGRLVADQILGRASAIDATPFAPDRFNLRA